MPSHIIKIIDDGSIKITSKIRFVLKNPENAKIIEDFYLLAQQETVIAQRDENGAESKAITPDSKIRLKFVLTIKNVRPSPEPAKWSFFLKKIKR